MPIPGERLNYEMQARDALQKGNVAEAQVWATLYQGKTLEGVRSALQDVASSTSEVSTNSGYIYTELERIRGKLG